MTSASSNSEEPTFALWVGGVPRAWQRAGAHGRSRYTQRDDRAWRQTVRAAWLAEVGALSLSGPLSLTLVFAGARADWDNAAKAVADALGRRGWPDGLAPAYRDDKQIVEAHVYLVPATCREAGAFIAVTPIGRALGHSARRWRFSTPRSSRSVSR